MGAKTKFSASEAAEAMNYMAMAGWKTSDLQAVVLLLCDLPFCKSLVCLFRRRFQGFQLFLCLPHRFPKEPVLLCQQLRIAGIKFQKVVDIPKL